MRYKRVYPKTSIKTVDLLATDGATGTGCYLSDGKILPGLNSLVMLNRIRITPSAAWYVAGLKMHVIFGNNVIYHAKGEFVSPTIVNLVANNPSVVEMHVGATTQAYVIGDTEYYCLGTGTFKPFEGEAHSCILKNGRIFGIDVFNPYKIKWSGEGGIDDWEEGISGAGWTTVQYDYGEILNLIVYKDKIVALREHGLTFFSAYGTPENYKLNYFESKLPKIYKNTAAVVGTKLAFYTEDGLYFYDGNGVEKFAFGPTEDIQSPISACGANGKYFLCGLSKTLKNKGVLVYDEIENTLYLSRATASALLVGENIYFYTGQYEYRLESGGTYTFTGGKLDFSSNGIKLLKEIKVNVSMEVFNGKVWHAVNNVRGKFRPNLRGKSFIIKVYAKEKINGVSAVAEVLNGV